MGESAELLPGTTPTCRARLRAEVASWKRVASAMDLALGTSAGDLLAALGETRRI